MAHLQRESVLDFCGRGGGVLKKTAIEALRAVRRISKSVESEGVWTATRCLYICEGENTYDNNNIILNMNKVLQTLFFLSNLYLCNGQDPIDVTEQTLRIAPKEEKSLYYAFAEGDKIIFDFEEAAKDEIKEVEIIELPENSRYRDYEVKRIKNKTMKVDRKAIYKFRFYNAGLKKGRTCKIKIQRIPKDHETISFNTGVRWMEKIDTTYEIKTEKVIVRYDTTSRQESQRALVSSDTNVVVVIDRTERVHSISNLSNENSSTITFSLPKSRYYPSKSAPYEATETIAWAYSIATGESGAAWYKEANSIAAVKTGTRLAISSGLISSGYGALFLLAVEGYSIFSNPPQGDNVKFRFFQEQNKIPIYGNSVTASARMTDCYEGIYSIKLENDNQFDGINVDVKILAVTVTKRWKDEVFTIQEVRPIKEDKTSKVPKISIVKIPFLIEK